MLWPSYNECLTLHLKQFVFNQVAFLILIFLLIQEWHQHIDVKKSVLAKVVKLLRSGSHVLPRYHSYIT